MPPAQTQRLLNDLYARYHRAEFIGADPVSLAHPYTREEDIETAGLIASVLAYGRAAQIKTSVGRVLAALGPHPHDTLGNFTPRQDGKRFAGFVHRFTAEADMVQFLDLAARQIHRHGRLKHAVLAHHRDGDPLEKTMAGFVAAFRSGTNAPRSHLRYMLPSPADGSACKRLCLYLRWMVRPADGVDFGLWPEIGAHRLVMPLDTHVARIGRALGLLKRKSNDWKAALEVTASLRAIAPDDPVRYDFAITHVGITGQWRDLIGRKRARY